MTDPSSYSRLSPNLMHFSWRRDHLSQLATRRPAGVCSGETGQTCLLPRWGFSTYWGKEWGWRGEFEGVQLRGRNMMRASFPVGPSCFLPLGWLTSNWGNKEQEMWVKPRRWKCEGSMPSFCPRMSYLLPSRELTSDWRVEGENGWKKMRPPS